MTIPVDIPEGDKSKEHILAVAAGYKYEPMNGKSGKGNKQDQKEIVHYLPYWQESAAVYESVHVDGKPTFLKFDKTKFSVEDEIVLAQDDKSREIIKPVSDIPYEPYNFSSKEIEQLSTRLQEGERERKISLIYDTISPYQFTEDWHKKIDSVGILLSYEQNKVKTVPYIAKVAASESGKTRSLMCVYHLAYRPMMAVDVTPANIYRYYGKDLQGTGTIIHDEIDDGSLDNDKAMRSIYNAGYKYGAKVPRIGGDHQETQDFYNCFGIKWLGGTDLPYSKTLRSRMIEQKFIQGEPEKIDIEDSDIEQFHKVRKELLVFRMLSAFDKLPLINTSLRGRSRELYKPLLQVVYGTSWYDTLLSELQRLDQERTAEDKESKQAYLARAVISVWLDVAAKALDLEEVELEGLVRVEKELFVSNAAVIANMKLIEATNEKGRKVLVSDEIPFTYSTYDIGKLQAENLKGKRDMDWNDDNTKKLRGYRYDLKTIRQLNARYGLSSGTFGTHGTPNSKRGKGQTGDNPRSEKPPNDPENQPDIHQNGVPSVPSVPRSETLVKCPYCPARYSSKDLVIKHGIKAHPGKPISDDLDKQGQT